MSKQSGVKETIHYTIRQLEDFSGDKAKIYGVILDNNQLSELDNFIVKYENTYPDDVDFIIEPCMRSQRVWVLSMRSFGLMKEENGDLFGVFQTMTSLTHPYDYFVSLIRRIK